MRYKCTVSYCGAAYCGWQSQKNGASIQEQIENALFQLTTTKTNITASGRTDAGVNAEGQVFHFDTELVMTERKWKGALNALLPKDIHIREVEAVDELFHARYCVKAKRYDYRVNLGEYDVFTKDYVYQCPYPVDVQKIREAAAYLQGKHNFASFCSNSFAETPDQTRTLYAVDVSQQGQILTISYYGKGFLRYMVRMMTAQLLEAGRGRIQPEEIKVLLEAQSKTVSRRKAKPEGLTLKEVEYFRILAMDQKVMIREYLPDDPAQPHASDEYAFVERNSQNLLGCLRITEGERVNLKLCAEEMPGEEFLQEILFRMHSAYPEKELILQAGDVKLSVDSAGNKI